MGATIVLPLPEVLGQSERWIGGQALDEMDRHHRANLIPFLRRNALALYAATFGVDADPAGQPEAEEWLEQTPLMRRLVELEQGRPIEERRETHERNQAYEAATGYRKITLRAAHVDGCAGCERNARMGFGPSHQASSL